MRIGLIYGGKSPEHDVSIRSAQNILKHLDATPLYIDKEGNWPISNIFEYLQEFDLIFPMIHGPNGEDGSLQGLLQLANVPFIGSDVTSSAICMDKDITKRLLDHAGLPIAPYTVLREGERYHENFTYPLFVKPANMGSSVGVTKVNKDDQLQSALNEAFRYGKKILVEQEIQGDEVEIALLDDMISQPAKLTPMHEFHNYDAKFHDPDGCIFEIPVNYPNQKIKKIQTVARRAYEVLECKGLARVDFFVRGDQIFLNEVNTLPGFTLTSLYPAMWESSDLSFKELLNTLVRQAVEANQVRKKASYTSITYLE